MLFVCFELVFRFVRSFVRSCLSFSKTLTHTHITRTIIESIKIIYKAIYLVLVSIYAFYNVLFFQNICRRKWAQYTRELRSWKGAEKYEKYKTTHTHTAKQTQRRRTKREPIYRKRTNERTNERLNVAKICGPTVMRLNLYYTILNAYSKLMLLCSWNCCLFANLVMELCF